MRGLLRFYSQQDFVFAWAEIELLAECAVTKLSALVKF